MIYKDGQSAVELLSNALRLPVKNSKIYEPSLFTSITREGDSSPEYAEYINDLINLLSEDHFYNKIPLENRLQLVDLATDPIPVWEFHLIDVRNMK